VIRGDNDMITIGENSQVQDGSVLHTDMNARSARPRNPEQ
jgi:carbonic anhydrase/acetyltransferase-like protein (isoleucine patch superfamily)